MKTLSILTLFCTLLLTACGEEVAINDGMTYVKAEKGATFKEPDIKNDFCGVHINFQFCKCAFHNDYCDNIGMDKSAANSHVYAEFNTYVADLFDTFTDGCSTLNGYIRGESCYVCPEGSEVEGEKCTIQEIEEIEETKDVAKEDCGDLDETWEKYSDIDWRIPTAERSYAAKEYARTQDEIVATYAEQAELVYETELLRQQLADVKEYKAALVDNLRDNLVKATLRLAYVTYSQVKGAKGAGESFSKLFTSTESLEVLGAGMKSVQAVMPGDSRLAINTKNAGGKVGSIGWNATLEAIESMGDPAAIAKQVMKDSKGALVPSADISPEEVEILRVQNLENNLLDDVIAEMQAQINENEAWLNVADYRIQELEAEVAKHLADEEDRVKLMLEDECK